MITSFSKIHEEKINNGGTTMNGISEYLVGLLLFPATVFVFIPLAMLVVWTLIKLPSRIAAYLSKAERSADAPVS
jgi:hypothetical protein